MRIAECGVLFAVQYSIAVCLHAENAYGRPVFSPCTIFVNPVAKVFVYIFSAAVSIQSGMDRYIDRSAIPHPYTAYRVYGKRTTVNVPDTVCLLNGQQ